MLGEFPDAIDRKLGETPRMSARSAWLRLARQALFVGLFLLAATACGSGGDGDGPRDGGPGDGDRGPAQQGGDGGGTTIATGAFPGLPIRSCTDPTLPVDGWARPALDVAHDGLVVMGIDGEMSDWAGRSSIATDRSGDSDPGAFDLRTVSAFHNADALYLLLEPEDPAAEITEMEIDLQADGRDIRVGWSPKSGWPYPWIGDFSTDEWLNLDDNRRSMGGYQDAVELRVDLRTLDHPSEIRVTEIRLFSGECCGPGWHAADELLVDEIVPAIDERDPRWQLADEAGAVEAATLLATPETRAIEVVYDPIAQRAAIVGSEAAVPPNAVVMAGNLELNDFDTVQADQLGRFEADVVARPGTHIMVKQDTTGRFIRLERQEFDEDQVSPGVLIPIPVAQTSDGISFASGGRFCCDNEKSASWAASGTFERRDVEPGDKVPISGRIELLAGLSVKPRDLGFDIWAELVSDAGGRQFARDAKFVSSYLTATGLPIEISRNGDGGGEIHLSSDRLRWREEGGHWVSDFQGEMEFPKQMRDGLYNVFLGPLWIPNDNKLAANDHDGVLLVIRDRQSLQGRVGTFTVGEIDTPRLSTTLFSDVVTEGARGGIIAREDAGLFEVSPRAMARHDPVLPRLDAYGESWEYRLEPHVPMLDVVDRALPNPPVLDLDLTRSVLRVTVKHPDGTTNVLGPAPLTRYAVKSPTTVWGAPLGGGGGELRELPQLLGDGDTFAYAFPSDGDYVVTLEGAVAGTDGTIHGICGTYDVTVAEPLDIEASFLPGTPFEIGNAIGPTLTALPGIPVDVTFDVRVVAADGTTTEERFSGRSNDRGWWDGDGAVLTFTHDGEYLVDIEARGTDPAGDLWVGRQRFGGIVATPDAPIIAHGRRGPDNQDEIAPPWAFETAFEMQTSDHMQFPYFTGDILWGMENTDAGDAIVSHVSVQPVDERHPLVERALLVAGAHGDAGGVPFSDALRAGQVPLVTGTEPYRDVVRGGHPDDVDLWSYMYVSAQRPGVRVREIIQGSDVSGSYWRFGDPYMGQSGNGPEGDTAGDFKFLYGGAVIRDPKSGEGIYAIYGSAWVHTFDDDPLGARFFPPFRGAAGGPDGGPLLTVHGREVDLFFMPMAVRPGAVLSVGDTFRMAGPIMPTLPSLVEYTVTAPDGATRSHSMRGNAVGYAYDPSADFTVDQQGVWTVDVLVTHDGQTSAGPVEPPFPTGGVLSPDGRTFTFVVEDEATARSSITTELSELPLTRWYERIEKATFEAELPSGWEGDEARLVVTMPGIVLVDEVVRVRDGRVAWTMVPDDLNRLALNFDSQWSIGDTVTVTVHAAGGDARSVGTIVVHGARVPLASGA